MRSMIGRKLFAGLAAAGLLGTPLAAMAGPATAGARPYLGMAAEAVAKDATPNGVTVHSVTPDSPAGKAGLKGSDRIVMADGKEVKTFADLKEVLAGHKPGDQVPLKVVRDGAEQTVTVTLGEAPAPRADAAPTADKPGPFLGVFSQPLSAGLKERLGADKGAVVTHVIPGSPAATAGLMKDDAITHVGDVAVNTPEELRDAVRKAGTGKDVTLKVFRGGKTIDFTVRLQEAPSGVTGLPGFAPEMPGGFEDFSGHFRPFFPGIEKVPALEKKVQELENRVRELEQKPAK
jgi:S1-C subfamily serine protease